jgi:hypothetical protein
VINNILGKEKPKKKKKTAGIWVGGPGEELSVCIILIV